MSNLDPIYSTSIQTKKPFQNLSTHQTAAEIERTYTYFQQAELYMHENLFDH